MVRVPMRTALPAHRPAEHNSFSRRYVALMNVFVLAWLFQLQCIDSFSD